MYQRILVAIDDSACSDRAIEEAIALASAGRAELRFVHLIEGSATLMSAAGFWNDAPLWQAQLREAGSQLLAAAKDQAREAGVVASVSLLDPTRGALNHAIQVEVGSWNADLLVLGSHGRTGMARTLIGSHAEDVTRHCEVPVLLVQAENPTVRGGRIQVAQAQPTPAIAG